jgi:hypothetical protein
MRWWARTLTCGSIPLLLLAVSVELFGQSSMDLIGSRRRARGQAVAPVFEGWAPNPDGTFSMHFGYMNRNWDEEVDIPIGPNNFFEPGPQDQGQPTHFLTNRQKRNFSVVVPKDFGTKTLTWTLVRNGSTERVPGKLGLIFQIDPTQTNDSVAPILTMGPPRTVVFPEAATLVATVAEPGQPKAGRGGRPVVLTVKWRQYRGPGKVTFGDPAPPLKDGKTVTTVTVSQPGVYQFQALAENGSSSDSGLTAGIPGFMCCWTTALTTVTVDPAPGSGPP